MTINREHPLKLSIIIIHYNTSGDLERCLDSIDACPPLCEYRVLVVDNASSDPGLEPLRTRHAGVQWIMNTQNAGYSRGVNQGLQAQSAEYSLILNPDIVVQPRAIDRLLERADANPRAGILGPQLLNTDGSIQDSCRRFYTFTTLLMRRTPLGKVIRNHKSVGDHLMQDFDHLSERPVDWVLGGCMLVRRDAVDRVGKMDERFFLYFEDVDWCWRMGRGGYDVLYVPDARFEHRHRRESAGGVTRRSFWMHLGSLISFYEKWGMLAWLLKRWRDPLQMLLLWLTDIIGLNLAFAGAYTLRAILNPVFPESLYPFAEYRPLLVFASLLASASFALMGRYRPGAGRRPLPLGRWLQQIGMISLLLLASTWLSHQDVYSRAVLLVFIPMFALTSQLSSRFYHWMIGRMEQGNLALERTIFVGRPQQIREWQLSGESARSAGLDPVGYLLPERAGRDPEKSFDFDLPCLGSVDALVDTVDRYHVSQVVFWEWPRGELQELHSLTHLRRQRVRLRWLVNEAALLSQGARADDFASGTSIVLDPALTAVPGILLEKSGRLLAGLLLFLIGFPLVTLGRGLIGWRIREVNLEPGDDPATSPALRVVVNADGKIRHLMAQPWLGIALLQARMGLTGQPVTVHGNTKAQSMKQAWQLQSRRPGLTGSWAGESLGQRLAALWRDPANLSTLLNHKLMEDE